MAKIQVAFDNNEAEAFVEWLNNKGHEASVSDTSENSVDGQLTSINFTANSTMWKLWEEFCNHESLTVKLFNQKEKQMEKIEVYMCSDGSLHRDIYKAGEHEDTVCYEALDKVLSAWSEKNPEAHYSRWKGELLPHLAAHKEELLEILNAYTKV